MTTETLAIYI